MRYGLVVSGYSGRDENVMAMLSEAVEQNDAFPHGLFWTVPKLSYASGRVRDFISLARGKGISANIVETGTFDEMLSKIWRNIEAKPPELEAKVRRASFATVNLPLPDPGNRYPILRTNALPILELPRQCGSIDVDSCITLRDLRGKMREQPVKAVFTYTDKVQYWDSTGAKNPIFIMWLRCGLGGDLWGWRSGSSHFSADQKKMRFEE